MLQFTIADDRDLQLDANETLRAMYALSPYVWSTDGRFDVLIRAVNRADDPAQKIARIYHGRSQDGLTFAMDDEPDIAPGLDPDDRNGCEDPSVAESGGHLYVYYTGWNQRDKVGKLMLATGLSPCALRKLGVVLDSTATDRVLMFYNGATQDGAWRIGWVLLDAESFAVVDRGEQPIIIPPAPKGDEADIAFAASAVRANGSTWLYYSIADKQMKRAVLRYR